MVEMRNRGVTVIELMIALTFVFVVFTCLFVDHSDKGLRLGSCHMVCGEEGAQ